MNSNLPGEHVIREYLLGTLPEEEWDEIEEKLLSDKEFADFVDSIEDEIIEEYLTIQNHFLRPPERQRKLLFASVLHSRLKKKEQAQVSIDIARQKPAKRIMRAYWAPGIAAAAILIFLTVPLGVYTANLYSAVKTAKANTNRVESLLAQAGSEVMALQSELRSRTIADVELEAANREMLDLPEFRATAATKSILVNIRLNSTTPALYHGELRVSRGTEDNGKVLWTVDNLQPADRGLLVIVIPYDGPGRYSLKVTPNDQPTASASIYPFNVVLATHSESQH